MKVAERTAELQVANDELNALRHVATLVAEGVEPQDLFAVVAEEVAHVVDVPLVSVVRYEPDLTATECASYSAEGPPFPVGKRWSLEGTNVLRLVRVSSEPARIDDHSQLGGEIADVVRRTAIRSTVGIPIVVAGQVWGAMVGSTRERDPLPEGTEARLADFTELLATAIENAESREALGRLADEQAALRRVATLVAQGVQPAEVFSAVSEEVGRLFGSNAGVSRFESEGSAMVVVGVGKNLEEDLVGTRWELDDSMPSTRVYRTGRSARVEAMNRSSLSGPYAEAVQRRGIVSIVASPIVLQRRRWGVITVASTDQPLPPDVEQRLEKFTELVATAIANADSRSELAASSRRIVAASDEARRRIERDLHDGTQQRLISLGMAVRAGGSRRPSRQPRTERQAVPYRDGSGRCVRGPARAVARDPPCGPVAGRPRPGVANAGSPLDDPCRTRRHDEHPAPRADRGRGVLRRVGGPGERDEACAGIDHRGHPRNAQRTSAAVDTGRRHRRGRPHAWLRSRRPHRPDPGSGRVGPHQQPTREGNPHHRRAAGRAGGGDGSRVTPEPPPDRTRFRGFFRLTWGSRRRVAPSAELQTRGRPVRRRGGTLLGFQPGEYSERPGLRLVPRARPRRHHRPRPGRRVPAGGWTRRPTDAGARPRPSRP